MPVSISGLDQMRGQRTQSFALALLQHATMSQHIPTRARQLMVLALAGYTAAMHFDTERTDRSGRDLLLSAPIDDLPACDQALAASIVALQRDKVRPNREPAFLWLSEKNQHIALMLTAIVRLARALDDEAVAHLQIHSVDETSILSISRALPEQQLVYLTERAALWQEQIGPLVIRSAALSESDSADRTDTDQNNTSVDSADTATWALPDGLARLGGSEVMAEAARRMLRRFFDKLLAREDAVLKGEDSEDIHQMRVATRRLRASLQVVEGIFQPKLIRRYRRGLRNIAASLGAVRDGDVFLEHLATYRDGLPETDRDPLDVLVTAVTAERAAAREQLLQHLSAKRYNQLKRQFAEFLTTPGAGVIVNSASVATERVRDFAGSAIWRRYEQWRAYEVVLPHASHKSLHQARIAGKRFRYTLEFFAEVLGSNVEQVLAPLVALQETLGALQDDVTAREHIAALGLEADVGAQAYLAAREHEHSTVLATLPTRWDKVASATYRRRLFELIIKL